MTYSSIKITFLLALSLLITSCGDWGIQLRNEKPFAISKVEVEDGVALFDGTSSVSGDVNNPDLEYEWTFSLPGSSAVCSPAVGFFPAGGIPSEPLILSCSNGETLQVSGNAQSPVVLYANANNANASQNVQGCLQVRDLDGVVGEAPEERGACQVAPNLPSSQLGSANITGPNPLSINTPINIVGTCEPDGVGEINVMINGASPSSIGPCDCVGGQVSCPAVTFTQLPENPVIETTYNNVTDTFVSTTSSTITSSAPSDIMLGTVTYTGTCAPDAVGSINVSVPGASPSNGGPCDCIGGSYSCDVDYTSVPSSPTATLSNNAGVSGPSTVAITPGSVESIDLNNPGSLSLGSPVNLTGSCSPNGSGNVSVSIANATPSSLVCDCSGGSLDCPAVSFTELPVSPSLVASLGSASDTENTSSNSFLDIVGPSVLSVGNNTVTGTCAPDSTGSISLSIPGATPNTAGPCDCSGGSFNCPVNFSSLPTNPAITGTNNQGQGGPSTDTLNPATSASIDLINPGNLEVGVPVTLTGSCSPNGTNNITIAMTGASPSSQSCSCSSGSIACSAVTFTELPASPALVASLGGETDTENTTTNSSIDITGPADVSVGNNTFVGTCGPDGTDNISLSIPGASPNTADCSCSGGAFSCPVNFTSLPANPVVTASENDGANGPASDTLNPTVSANINLNNPGNLEIGVPVTFAGVCSPDGSNNINISIAGAVPNSQTCSCTSGAISCSAITFTELPASPAVVASLGGENDTENTTTNSSIDITGPNNISVGINTFVGICGPDGTDNVSLSIPGADPSTSDCSCSGGAFSCVVDFTSLPANPVVTASENDGANGPATDTLSPAVTAGIDLDAPGNLQVGVPITFGGSCSPNGINNVSITIAGAMPNSQTCSCSSGNVMCAAITFTELPASPAVVASLGGETDTENTTTNSSIDITGPASISVGNNTFIGTCGPDGTNNISLSIPGADPSTAGCSCSGGVFSCLVDFTSLPANPAVTASENDGANGPATDVLNPSVSAGIDLDNPGNLEVGVPVTFGGSCSPNGTNNVSVAIAGATPSSQTCSCSAGAISCSAITFTELPASPAVVASLGGESDTENTTTNSSVDITGPANLVIGSNTFTGTCGPDGTDNINISIPGGEPASSDCSCSGGVFSCPVNITSLPANPTVTVTENEGANGPAADTINPSVSENINLNNPGNLQVGSPVTFTGVCSPNGSATVSIAIASATPNSQICDCAAGAISCTAITFTELPASPELVASLGGETDTENTTTNSSIDITGPSNLVIGSNTYVGTCGPDGTNNISVSVPGATPSSTSCSCDGGVFSCPVTYTDLPANPTATASENDGANGPATDTLTPTVNESIDLTNPGTLTFGEPVTFVGSCSPNGSNNITLSIAGAVPNSHTCNCISSSIDCAPIAFSSLPENTVIGASLGGASDTETTDVSSKVTLNSVSDISYGINTYTGTCSPDATGSITINTSGSGTTPNTSAVCDCVNSSFSCDINYTAISPGSHSFTVTNTVGNGANSTDTQGPVTVTNSFIDMDDLAFIDTTNPVTFTGTCAPDSSGGITVDIPGATPDEVTCDCVSGSLDCPATTFSMLPPSPPTITGTETTGANGPAMDTISPDALYPIEIVDGSVSTGSGSTTGPTTTFTFTPTAGNNRLAVVNLHKDDGTTNAISAVDYGGQAMTLVSAVVQGAGNGFRTRSEIWMLDEAGINNLANNTVTVTWSGNTANIAYNAFYLQNVDQAAPIIGTGSNGIQSTNTISITAAEAGQSATYVTSSHGSPVSSYSLSPLDSQTPDPFYSDAQGSFIGGFRLIENAGNQVYTATANNTFRMVIQYVNFRTIN